MSKTNLYLSGSLPIENFMRTQPKIFDQTGILLSYYFARTEGGATRDRRRLKAMVKNKDYKGSKRGNRK